MSPLVAPHNDYRLATPDDDWSPPTATVVIPVFNRVELLERTLAGLCAQTTDTPVIVVDDGSEEDARAVVTRFEDRLDIRCLRQENQGYGAGRARNLGAETASTDVILFLDADCIPSPDLVEHHLSHHTFSNCAVIGGRRHVRAAPLSIADLADGNADLAGAVVDDGSRDFRVTLTRRTSRMTTGTEAFRAFVSSNVSVGREIFIEAGGFSDEFNRWGGEDTELGWRLQQVGCFFVPDEEAVVFHQVDLDGPEGWRGVDRHHNEGLIVSKIPHRFYRKRSGSLRNQTPKVSFVVWPVPDDVQTTVLELLSSSLGDIEVVLAADSNEHEPFAGLASGDSRVVFAEPDRADKVQADKVQAGIAASSGELIALVHGDVAVDRRAAGRIAKRMDDRPRITTSTVGYRVVERMPSRGSEAVWTDHLRSDDPAVVDNQWGRTLPLAAVARRRDWIRCLAAGMTPEEAWNTMRGWDIADHLSQPLVWVPGSNPTSRPPGFRVNLPDLEGLRTLLANRKPVAAVRLGISMVRRRGEPVFRSPDTNALADSRPQDVEGSDLDDTPVRLRYVGWTGRDNLGDEAMLEAIRALMPFAEISTSGEAVDGLVLGGGTLINRTTYLRWLVERDSPRVERVIFGTGVASPEFWGITEDVRSWLDYLSSCAYVGVRGPNSAATLREWGYDGEVEIVGDPALSLRVTDPPARTEGRIIVAPAWTKGELWGGDDDRVFSLLGDAVANWLAEGREVALFACHPDDDRPCIEIARRAGRPDLPHHFGYLSTDKAMRFLATAEIVVAERLHAAVLAAAAGSSFVALEYRPKLADFTASVAATDWTIRTDELNLDRLSVLVSDAPRQLATVQPAVDEYRKRLAAAAARVGAAFGR